MMDSTKVAQMVEVLNGLRARDALCFLSVHTYGFRRGAKRRGAPAITGWLH